jgi:hypothetical protein
MNLVNQMQNFIEQVTRQRHWAYVQSGNNDGVTMCRETRVEKFFNVCEWQFLTTFNGEHGG